MDGEGKSSITIQKKERTKEKEQKLRHQRKVDPAAQISRRLSEDGGGTNRFKNLEKEMEPLKLLKRSATGALERPKKPKIRYFNKGTQEVGKEKKISKIV